MSRDIMRRVEVGWGGDSFDTEAGCQDSTGRRDDVHGSLPVPRLCHRGRCPPLGPVEGIARGSGDEVALGVVDAEYPECFHLAGCLYSFSDQGGA
jgi:hypothetical protein